jgi:hypothetical protein
MKFHGSMKPRHWIKWPEASDESVRAWQRTQRAARKQRGAEYLFGVVALALWATLCAYAVSQAL